MNNHLIKQTIKYNFAIPFLTSFLASVLAFYGVFYIAKLLGFNTGCVSQFQYLMLGYFCILSLYRNARIAYQNLKKNNLYSLSSREITCILGSLLAVYFILSYLVLRPLNSANISLIYAAFTTGFIGFSMWRQERELQARK